MTTVKFFDKPFGVDGDQAVIPDAVQPGGNVSFDQGYGPDYQLAPGTPSVLYPERTEFNYLMYAITSALQMWQVHAFPDWVSSSDNGGTPYPYDKNAFVRYTDGNIYISLVTTNTATPSTDPTKWALFNPFPSVFFTGLCMQYENITLPDGAATSAASTSGWVWANGQTIGDASSNATGRANADTQALFIQTWNSYSNAVRPILNSDGSPGIRGASASADWTAHKALPVRDMRDVVSAGLATMGGTTNRGLLNNTPTGGVDAAVFGSTGGAQGVSLTAAQNATHNHDGSTLGISVTGTPTVTVPLNSLNQDAPPGGLKIVGEKIGDGFAPFIGNFILSLTGSFTFAVTGNTGNSGSGSAHNNVQPTTITNFIIKL